MHSFKTRLRRLEIRLQRLLEKLAREREEQRQEEERLQALIPLALKIPTRGAEAIAKDLQHQGMDELDAEAAAWDANDLYYRARQIIQRARKENQDPHHLVRQLGKNRGPEPLRFWLRLLDALLPARSQG